MPLYEWSAVFAPDFCQPAAALRPRSLPLSFRPLRRPATQHIARTRRAAETDMKTGIHPDVNLTEVSCTCGNKFHIISRHEKLSIDICSACHPFYTGTQKFVDSAGRVDAFTKRFQWKEGEAVKAAEKKAVPRPTKRIQKDLKTELEKKKVFGKKKIVPELEGKGGDDRGGPRG